MWKKYSHVQIIKEKDVLVKEDNGGFFSESTLGGFL